MYHAAHFPSKNQSIKRHCPYCWAVSFYRSISSIFSNLFDHSINRSVIRHHHHPFGNGYFGQNLKSYQDGFCQILGRLDVSLLKGGVHGVSSPGNPKVVAAWPKGVNLTSPHCTSCFAQERDSNNFVDKRFLPINNMSGFLFHSSVNLTFAANHDILKKIAPESHFGQKNNPNPSPTRKGSDYLVW